MCLRAPARIIAGCGGHAGIGHFQRHAVGLLALPAIQIDEKRKEALKGLIGMRGQRAQHGQRHKTAKDRMPKFAHRSPPLVSCQFPLAHDLSNPARSQEVVKAAVFDAGGRRS
jgi:hypothetical protein